MHRRIVGGWCALALLAGLGGTPAQADEAQRQQVVSKAIAYLLTKGQDEDGAFSASRGPAVTALVTTALLKNQRSPDDPAVQKALQYIERFVQKDGGIYREGSTHRNYETSIAMQCLVEANRNGKYNQVLAAAEKFLKGIQWDEDEGKDPSDFAYGGAGYGSHKRPDLSNTSFFIDALVAAGADADDEAIQRALVFVSRCQNLESEHNRTPYAAKNPDGGFYYTPSPGQSQAGETETGGLRSYASMTYAGLKSMIFAGVGPDDPRVKAAVDWISKHYDLDQNPGMGDAGLYYYYHTFAKALNALGKPELAEASGEKHDWRADLISELASRQQADGSWVNENDRWMEGDPNLVTGYALLALAYCKP